MSGSNSKQNIRMFIYPNSIFENTVHKRVFSTFYVEKPNSKSFCKIVFNDFQEVDEGLISTSRDELFESVLLLTSCDRNLPHKKVSIHIISAVRYTKKDIKL